MRILVTGAARYSGSHFVNLGLIVPTARAWEQHMAARPAS